MRLLLYILVLVVTQFGVSWGQVAVSLDQWPARLQLYPRDQRNQCTVNIAGRVSVDAVRAVSLVVLRNQQRVQYTRIPVDSITGRFAFQPVIKAELSEYSFQLFAHPPVGDSVQVARRDSIVCGDVYLVTGQSNAIGRFDTNPFRSEFCRSFGVNVGDVQYNPDDVNWCLTNTTEGNNALWSVELQRLIQQQHGIPTAVINGAVGSTFLADHVKRDSNQPFNMGTIYGRLLYRAQKAGVAGNIKAIIWRQGESEAAANPDDYSRLFPQLYGYWKQDYPGLGKVYHAQINLLTYPVVKAGALRDYQRQSKKIFGDNEPIATIGLPAYQGLHYGEAGYRQFGAELFRLVARDFYGSTDTSNIRSPDIKRIFYSTPTRDELVLEFDSTQVMRWQPDTVIVNPANGARYAQSLNSTLFTDYPSGETNLISSVTEQNNRLILKLNKSVTGKTLTYTPSYYQDTQIGYYVGPVIRNRRGMRAFTFYQVPIADPLPVASDLRAIPVDTSAIKLVWSETAATIDQWIVERADPSGVFKKLVTLPGSAVGYNDARTADSLRLGTIYRYRIRSVGRTAEAGYSPVVTASLQLVLATKPPLVELPSLDPGPVAGGDFIYPNPASDQVWIRLPLDWNGDVVTITVASESGATVLRRSERVSPGASAVAFSVATLPAGIYVVSMQYRAGGIRCRLVVSR